MCQTRELNLQTPECKAGNATNCANPVACLESMIMNVFISIILRLLLAFVATKQTNLSPTWSETQKTGFLVTWLICMMHINKCAAAFKLFYVMGLVSNQVPTQKHNYVFRLKQDETVYLNIGYQFS